MKPRKEKYLSIPKANPVSETPRLPGEVLRVLGTPKSKSSQGVENRQMAIGLVYRTWQLHDGIPQEAPQSRHNCGCMWMLGGFATSGPKP